MSDVRLTMLRKILVLALTLDIALLATAAQAEAPLSASATMQAASSAAMQSASTPLQSAAPLPASALVSSSLEPSLPMADRVIVDKSDRKLQLLHHGGILRSYKIALGLRPEGHKQFEGDFRTPEGKYRLTRRNPNSEYFLSIQIDYPNDQDVARAKSQGLKPGGAIMIHGQPNLPRKSRDYYTNVDWTEGCIAVSNSDMVEIWLMTPPGTPIEIRP